MPVYKQFIIDNNEEELRNITVGRIQDVFRARANSVDMKSECKEADMFLVEALDHYVAKRMSENTPNGKRMQSYVSEAIKEFQNNRFVVYSNPVFALSRDVLSNYISKDVIDDIEYHQQHLATESQRINRKLMNHIKDPNENEKPTAEETRKLIDFFSSQTPVSPVIDTNAHIGIEKAKKRVVSYLIENNIEFGLRTSIFILKHLAHEHMKKEGLKCQFVIGDMSDINTNGVSYGGKANVNRRVLKNAVFKDNTLADEYGRRLDGKKDGLKLIHTVYHELHHEKQYKESCEHSKSDSSIYMATYELLEKYETKDKRGLGDYHRNYRHHEIERDANYEGWRNTNKTLKEYAPNRLEQSLKRNIEIHELTELYKREHAFRETNASRKQLNFQYIISNLDEIFEKHPEELSTYPQFEDYYHTNGNTKSLVEVLSNKDIQSEGDFYWSQVSAKIKRGELENIDITLLPENQQNIIISNLTDYFSSCHERIGRTEKVFKYNLGDMEPKIRNLNHCLKSALEVSDFLQGTVDKKGEIDMPMAQSIFASVNTLSQPINRYIDHIARDNPDIAGKINKIALIPVEYTLKGDVNSGKKTY